IAAWSLVLHLDIARIKIMAQRQFLSRDQSHSNVVDLVIVAAVRGGEVAIDRHPGLITIHSESGELAARNRQALVFTVVILAVEIDGTDLLVGKVRSRPTSLDRHVAQGARVRA